MIKIQKKKSYFFFWRTKKIYRKLLKLLLNNDKTIKIIFIVNININNDSLNNLKKDSKKEMQYQVMLFDESNLIKTDFF